MKQGRMEKHLKLKKDMNKAIRLEVYKIGFNKTRR